MGWAYAAAKRYGMASDHEFDAVALAWQRWFPQMQAATRPVSERMVALAHIGPGAHVLDVGTGLGDPALLAAETVAPNGNVIGVDISPAMLSLARKRAHKDGVSNVEFRQVEEDDEIPAGPYDAILSRFGLMFVPDLDRALAQYRAQLRRHARLVAATWATAPEVPQISTPMMVAAELGFVPQSPAPPTGSPFSLSDGPELTRRLEGAGFVDAKVEPIDITFRVESPEAYYRHVADVSPSVRELLATLDEPSRAELKEGVEQAAATRFGRPDGTVAMTNRALITTASNP